MSVLSFRLEKKLFLAMDTIFEPSNSFNSAFKLSPNNWWQNQEEPAHKDCEIYCPIPTLYHPSAQGVQWLSGRVLDSRPRGRGFEPHRRHCVVVLEQDTFILA